MPKVPTILVFDSGLGGLTVWREAVRARPDATWIYVADDAFFPYGRHGEAELIKRVSAVMATLITELRPDLVVVACNTASTLVLPHLRANHAVPFIGTVPAIKPACASSGSKRIAVLGTEATVAREYTRGLIREFAQGCDVALVGSARLAGFAEDELQDTPASDEAIAAELAPCFTSDGRNRTDTIVLACTHYPLLIERFRALAPWPVNWIDPAPAIARRVVDLIGPAAAQAPGNPARMIFTSGRTVPPALAAALAGFGLHSIQAKLKDFVVAASLSEGTKDESTDLMHDLKRLHN